MSQLLNQGAYGCIYYPGFTCKGNITKDKKYVTKLELKDRTTINEIEISKIIKKIKNYKKYFSIIEKHCSIKLNTFKENNNSLSECDVVNNNDFIYNDFILSYIKYIPSKDIDNYISSIDIPSIYIVKILNTLYQVLNNIKLLSKHNIIHFDLHGGNILYNLKTNTPIIIDFGLSINLNNIFNKKDKANIDFSLLKKSVFHYSPKHFNYAPEVHLITYLLQNYNELTNWNNQLLTSDILNTFIDDITNNNMIINSYYKENNKDKYREKYKEYLKIFYEKFINKNYSEIVINLLNYKFKWDFYMLMVNYILICINKLKKTELEKDAKKSPSIKIIEFLLELLIYNLHPDPYKRLRNSQFKKILSICFKNINNLSKDKGNIQEKITRKLDEENIKFYEYFIHPDFSLFKNENILNFINKSNKEITFS